MILIYIIAISHLGWILVNSSLFQNYRNWISSLHPLFEESSQCFICTITQLSFLTYWVFNLHIFDYFFYCLAFSKLSILIYDIGELFVNNEYDIDNLNH